MSVLIVCMGVKDRTSRFVRCGIRDVISRKNGSGLLPQCVGRKRVNYLILACINKTQRFKLYLSQTTVWRLGKMFSVVRVHTMVSNVLGWMGYIVSEGWWFRMRTLVLYFINRFQSSGNGSLSNSCRFRRMSPPKNEVEHNEPLT